MSFRCKQCGAIELSAPKPSVTGRQLCTPCWESVTGAAAGALGGGGVGGAIATAGWFSRVRRAIGRQ